MRGRKGPATPEERERMRKANLRRTSRLSHRLLRRKCEERLGGVLQGARESGKVKEKKTVRGDTAEGSRAVGGTRYPAIRKSYRKQRPLTMRTVSIPKNELLKVKELLIPVGQKKGGPQEWRDIRISY